MTGTVLDHVLEPVAMSFTKRQFQTALTTFTAYVEERPVIEA